jgi:hypothetical protein
MHNHFVLDVLRFVGVLKTCFWWLVDSMPDISNLILVLVGVLMSLPRLAQKIEDHKTARYVVSIGCVVLGLLGFVASSRQRQQFNSQIKQLVTDDDKLVNNTNSLVENTRTVVSEFGILMPQLAKVQDQIGSFDAKITAASNNNDTKLIASLKAERADAQTKADNISQTLLLTLAPGIVEDMQLIESRWSTEDGAADWEISNVDMLARQGNKNPTPEDVAAMLARLRKKREEMNAVYSRQAMPVLSTANYIRDKLFNSLNSADRNSRDIANVDIFNKTLTDQQTTWFGLEAMTMYLKGLIQRVAPGPPPPPTGLSTSVQ